jgi:hypothetical protein
VRKASFPLILAAALAISSALVAPACDDDVLLFPSNDGGPDSSSAGSGGSAGRDSGSPDARAGSGGSADGSDARADADAPSGRLDVCTRQNDVYELLNGFVPTYIGNVSLECRVAGLTQGPRVDSLFLFGQQVRDFSTKLWGCNADVLTKFGLIYEPGTVSPEDVAVLIGIYMDLAVPRLGLTSIEAASMRAELERLGNASLTPGASGLSYAACDGGEAGASDAQADTGVSSADASLDSDGEPSADGAPE